MARAKREKAKPKQRPKFTDKAQSERFIEAARTLGIERTGDAFDAAVHTLLTNNQSTSSDSFRGRKR
jgi:hypothetical protein